MIKKSIFEDELIEGMERELTATAQTDAVNSLDKAVDLIHSAIEIFEDSNMKSQADELLNILIKIANKNKKKVDPHTKGLTVKKMVENLKDHGSMFNLNDDGQNNDLLNADIETDTLSVSDNIADLENFEDEL